MFLVEIAKGLFGSNAKGDTSFYGVVKEQIVEGDTIVGYKVALGDDEAVIECSAFCNAQVGDLVDCKRKPNGEIVVSATNGGESGLKVKGNDEDANKKLDIGIKRIHQEVIDGTKTETADTDVTGFELKETEGSTVKSSKFSLSGIITSLTEFFVKGTGNSFVFKILKGTSRGGLYCGDIDCMDIDSVDIKGRNLDISNNATVDAVMYAAQVIGDKIVSNGGIEASGMVDATSFIRSGEGFIQTTDIPQYAQTYNAIWHKTTSGYYQIERPTSSTRKIKKYIKPVENEDLDAHGLYDVPVVQYKFKKEFVADADEVYGGKPVIGLIAEDIAEKFPCAAIYVDGEVDNWDERYLIPAMLKLIQEQNERIAKLEEILEKTEA